MLLIARPAFGARADGQHFLLSKDARDLPPKKVMRMSETISPGLPRRFISVVRSRATRPPGIEVSGIAARHSRVKSSTTFRIRKRHRVDKGYHGLRFQSDDLDKFLESVTEHAEPVTRPTSEMINLRSATARTRCKIAKIIQMIIDKELSWVGRDVGLAGLASILVYPADVMSALQPQRTLPEGLTASDASRKLQIPVNAFRALANRKIVIGKEFREPLSGRVRLRFSIAELDRFDAEFVSLHNLSRSLRRKTERVRQELSSRGVVPLPEMNVGDTDFYRRSDVQILR